MEKLKIIFSNFWPKGKALATISYAGGYGLGLVGEFWSNQVAKSEFIFNAQSKSEIIEQEW